MVYDTTSFGVDYKVKNLEYGMIQQPVRQDSHEANSTVLVNLITPADWEYETSLRLSILPSFLSRLAPSIHTLRITVIVPSLSMFELPHVRSKLSYFSIAYLENAAKNGVANLCFAVDLGKVTTTFGVNEPLPSVATFNQTFRLHPENRSETIFALIAVASRVDRRFVPINDMLSLSFSQEAATIVQLSLSPTPVDTSCFITRLPVELLSLIFDFLTAGNVRFVSQDNRASRLSKVCQLWKRVGALYLREPDSVEEKYARLKVYPNAGRVWSDLQLHHHHISVGMVKEVIAGAPNVTYVQLQAFWNEEDAKIVLNAIEDLTRMEGVVFGRGGWRKWRKEEVESFVRRTRARIRRLSVYGVADSSTTCALPASAGLQLPPSLISVNLCEYPPLQSLSFPSTLKALTLSHMCPLPPSISSSPLPFLLEELSLTLVPFYVNGMTSILPTPLDLSHLKHLTSVRLDGGEETSNLISRQIFPTLRNAKGIEAIDIRYCGVDWFCFPRFIFPDFIHWFFGNRDIHNEGDPKEGYKGEGLTRQRTLSVLLFFGEWQDEEIGSARRTMREFGVNHNVTWIREGGEE
ncbi:hypothetical protein BT69DRAFT_1349953 [Atractiella rhizophila]|nr:hypothetical protein BT69DRAFT_1349953 [Atractiella rhizophila]